MLSVAPTAPCTRVMAKFPSLLLLLLLDVPTVLSMLDYRHFASTKDPVPMPSFVDPGILPDFRRESGVWQYLDRASQLP